MYRAPIFTVWYLTGLLLLCTRGAVADEPQSGPNKESKPRALKPLTVTGFIQVHYRYTRPTAKDSSVDNSNFRVQRARIGVEGDVNTWLSYDVVIDPRSPEITGLLRDAYFTLRAIPRHRVRIGQQKTQFGYENSVSSTRLYAVNRAELSDALSRGINLRDIGIGVLGDLKLSQGWRLEDAITVVNGAGVNVQEDDTPRKNVFGRVGLRWKSGPPGVVAHIGFSGATGDFIDRNDPLDVDDDVHTVFTRQGIDVELDHPRFFMSAEYVRGTERDLTLRESDDPSGYYLNLVGKTRWHVGPIIRYDVFADEFERWTLGAHYTPPETPFRVMLNYEVRTLINGVRGDDKCYVWTQVCF